MLKRLASLLAVIAMLINLTACVHKMDVQQGQAINPAAIKKIHLGMTRFEVADTLGQPVLTQLFSKNQVVYIYTMKKGYEKTVRQHLTITFRDNRVTHISTN
jgi:outer membrane protein assembly factor BamE